MKKILIAIIMPCMFTGLISTTAFAAHDINLCNSDVQTILKNIQIFAEEPNVKLDKDLFVTLLMPHVDKTIREYYYEYFNYPPLADPWDYKFIKIEKNPEYNYSYVVVLEVMPYFGPHLTVGRDRITFKVELDGVRIDKFEHIESFELPPNYQDVIKKKMPSN